MVKAGEHKATGAQVAIKIIEKQGTTNLEETEVEFYFSNRNATIEDDDYRECCWTRSTLW